MTKYLGLKQMKTYTKSIYILTIVFWVFLGLSCEKRITQPENPNLPPNTTIANIPVAGDTLFALVTMYWDGGDDDGYVDGYQYRYITEHFDSVGIDSLQITDTVVQPWQLTTETSLAISFNSSAPLNRQTFQVRSVDNNGDVDTTAAEKVFYTRMTYFPETFILSPANNQKLFYLSQTTDWWKGILLIFNGFDKDGEIEEYGYSIDDDIDNINWMWTKDTSLYITPDMFQPPLDGEHVIRVTARDNTNLIDQAGSQVSIRLIQPTFNKDILIIDETDENGLPNRFDFTDEEMDSFYVDIFSSSDSTGPFRTVDSWDFLQNGLPPLDTLGQYKLVAWYADANSGFDLMPLYTDYLEEYLNVGGDLIVSGWRLLKSFVWTEAAPEYSFSYSSFGRNYLHVNKFSETRRRATDFAGLYGNSTGFSDLEVDSLKLAGTGSSTYSDGKLSRIDVITEKGVFTETLYTYRSSDENGDPTEWEGLPCVIRYYGTSYNTVVIGFPVFFLKQTDARVMMQEILTNLGY